MTNKKKLVVRDEVISRSTRKFAEKTGNLYEAVVVIGKRANQLDLLQQQAIKEKLEEFNKEPDTLQEIYQNEEQIEVSRGFEKQPKPTLVATEEFLADRIYFKTNNNQEEE